MSTRHPMPVINLYTAIVAMVGVYLFGIFLGAQVGHSHGREDATKSIAQACIDENTFNVDGYKFYCIDEDDYYDPTGVQDLDSSPAKKGADNVFGR